MCSTAKFDRSCESKFTVGIFKELFNWDANTDYADWIRISLKAYFG
jgi:hypothetical protein